MSHNCSNPLSLFIVPSCFKLNFFIFPHLCVSNYFFQFITQPFILCILQHIKNSTWDDNGRIEIDKIRIGRTIMGYNNTPYLSLLSSIEQLLKILFWVQSKAQIKLLCIKSIRSVYPNAKKWAKNLFRFNTR